MEKSKATPRRSLSLGSSQKKKVENVDETPSKAQEVSLETAIKKVKGELAKQSNGTKPIKTSALFKALREQVRIFRRSEFPISADHMFELVSTIDIEDNSMCKRFEPAVFAVIVEALLQAEPCREAERGLYLLADSLAARSTNQSSKTNLASRKDDIGKEVLLPLVGYFTDADNFHTMRRWAGILCGQLIKECSGNYARVDVGPDDLRKNIGLRMIEEDDELARIICGQFVRDLVSGGLSLAELFPDGYNNELYDDFPPSTQGNNRWYVEFDKYLDKVLPIADVLPDDEMYNAWEFSLRPMVTFGVPEKNVQILIRGEDITCMTASPNTNMSQLLDVPLDNIRDFVMKPSGDGNKKNVDIMIELAEDKEFTCYLDGESIPVNHIYFTGRLENLSKLVDRMERDCQFLRAGDLAEDEFDQQAENPTKHSQSQVEMRVDTTGEDEKEEDEEGGSADDRPKTSQASLMHDIDTGAHLGDEELEEQEHHVVDGLLSDDEKLEEDNLPPIPLPRARNSSSETPTQEQSDDELADRQTGGTDRLLRRARGASDQPTSEFDRESSPSQNRKRKSGQFTVSPEEKPVTKPASRPSRLVAIEPVPLDLTKKVIKPKAKQPIGLVRSSQAPIAVSQIDSFPDVQPLREPLKNSIKPKAKQPIGIPRNSQAPIAFSQIGSFPDVQPVKEPLKKPMLNAKSGTAAMSKPTKPKVPAKVPKKTQAQPKSRIKNKAALMNMDDDNDEITDPDPLDDPPPKTKTLGLLVKTKVPTVAAKETKSKIETAKVAAPKNPKRFSLKPQPLEPQPAIKDAKPVFDFPSDEEDAVESKTKSGKAVSKPKRKTMKSRKSAGDAESKPAPNIKRKRKSAPANIQPAIGTRHSQRGAATQANAKMKGADAPSDEADDEETQMPRAAAIKKAPNPVKDHVVDISLHDHDSGEETQLLKASTKNARQEKVPSKPVKAPSVDAVGGEDEGKAEKKSQPPVATASKKTGVFPKSQIPEIVDSDIDMEAETQLPKASPSTKRIKKTVVVTSVKVQAVDPSRSNDDDEDDAVTAKSPKKIVASEQLNQKPPVAKPIAQPIAQVQKPKESEQEDEVDFDQPDTIGAGVKKQQNAALESMEIEDISGNKETQMRPPKKMVASVSKAQKKRPIKNTKSEERVQLSKGSGNEKQVDEQLIQGVENIDAPSAPVLASTPLPIAKSKVATLNQVDSLNDDAERGRNNEKAGKNSTPAPPSSTRVLRNRVVDLTPKKAQSKPEVLPQFAPETVDEDVDMEMQHEYSQLLEDVPLIDAPGEEEEAVMMAPSPVPSKTNTDTKKKTAKTYSKSQKPKVDWATSLGQIAGVIGTVSSQTKAPKDAPENNTVVAEEPMHDREPELVSAPKQAQLPIQTPAIEEDNSAHVSNSVVKKKRKPAEDDQEFSNKRRIVQAEEVKSIPKPGPVSLEVKKTVEVEAASELPVSAPPETQPRSARHTPLSENDIALKKTVTAQTPARGSMAPPLLSAKQVNSTPRVELVDEHLQRKPHIVSFDADGPRNQGLPSAQTSMARRAVQTTQSEINVPTPPPASVDLKRKLDMVTSAAEHTKEEEPQKKKHSPSPPEIVEGAEDHMEVEQQMASSSPPVYYAESPHEQEKHQDDVENAENAREDDASIHIPSSPPRAATRSPTSVVAPKVAQAPPLRPTYRQSSGSSRVNHNGSPQPSPSILFVDRIGGLQQQISQEIRGSMGRSEKSYEDEPIQQTKTMLEPRARIASLPKAGPSSPSDSGDRRYVAHNEAEDGQYHSRLTKRVVKKQDEILDPFSTGTGKAVLTRSNSTFMERLRSRDSERRSSLQYQLDAHDVVEDEVADEPRPTKSSRAPKNLPSIERQNVFDVENEVDHKPRLSRPGQAQKHVPRFERREIFDAEAEVDHEPSHPRPSQALNNLSRVERQIDFDVENVVVNSMHQASIPHRSMGFKNVDIQNNHINARHESKAEPTGLHARDFNAKQFKTRSVFRSMGERSQPILFTRNSSRRVSTEDEDRTLVNESRGGHGPSSPSDSSGSSEGSSESSRTPQGDQPNENDEWNEAVRPHLRGIHNSLHRIADETMILLTEAEDAMNLVVKDYNKKGGKVLVDFEATHRKDTAEVEKTLRSKNDKVVQAYKQAHEVVTNMAKNSGEDSVSGFEAEWKKSQARTQEMITKGLSRSA